MPRQEVALKRSTSVSISGRAAQNQRGALAHRAVDRQRLVHVDDDEVIVAGLRTGELGGVELGGLRKETLEAVDPGFPLILSNVTPGKTSRVSIRPRAGRPR